nr:hypothetical protein CFP56_54919 [Quercus suber]
MYLGIMSHRMYFWPEDSVSLLLRVGSLLQFYVGPSKGQLVLCKQLSKVRLLFVKRSAAAVRRSAGFRMMKRCDQGVRDSWPEHYVYTFDARQSQDVRQNSDAATPRHCHFPALLARARLYAGQEMAMPCYEIDCIYADADASEFDPHPPLKA